ncbi:MAG: hypothetical protein EA401_10975 [Planctomycetota bacterium]|nr:MAG: hypothetical protein EA401_10975 [Planctomycetota bacterium]
METQERFDEKPSTSNEVYRLPAWTMLLGAAIAILGVTGLFVPWFSISGSSSFGGQMQARSSVSAMGYDIASAWVAAVFAVLTTALITVGCLLRSLNKVTALTLSGILAGLSVIMLITAISALSYMGGVGGSYSVSSDFGGASVRGSAGWTMFIFSPLLSFICAGVTCGMWFRSSFTPIQTTHVLSSERQHHSPQSPMAAASTTTEVPQIDRRPLFRKIIGVVLMVLGSIAMLGFAIALLGDDGVIGFMLFSLWGISGVILFDFGLLLASQYQLSYVIRRIYTIGVRYSLIIQHSSESSSRFPSGIGWVFLLIISLPLWFISLIIIFGSLGDGDFIGMVIGGALSVVSLILADLVIYFAARTGLVIPRLKKMAQHNPD